MDKASSANKPAPRAPAARMGRTRLRLALVLTLLLAAVAGPAPSQTAGAGGAVGATGSPAQPEKKTRTYGLPTDSTKALVQSAVDSIRIWETSARSLAGSRRKLYGAVARLLRQNDRFAERTAAVYPKGKLIYVLTTDEVADTLTTRLYPLLNRYVAANPSEILTEGREKVEGALMKITGLPSAPQGYQFVRLAGYEFGLVDTLLARKASADTAGMQDGVLRSLADGGSLYQQVHKDPISIYQTRVSEEEWIIDRLVDNCGHAGVGTWRLGPKFMSQGVDTTVTPYKSDFAHELHLIATHCQQDTLVIYVSLPNFREMEAEVHKLHESGGARSGENGPGR